LAPKSSLNGPSYENKLNSTGRMLNESVSYQLGDWNSDSNNITFGGNVEEAFAGHLKWNLILTTSPWLFNVNFQGIMYGGVRASRNESFGFGSVDPLMFDLAIPKNDYQ
jgi:hypothetical protein